MSDDEIGVEEVHQECKSKVLKSINVVCFLVEQLKNSAKRKKGRGFTSNEPSGDSRGTYETLKSEGPGPQRSIDVSHLVLKDKLNFKTFTKSFFKNNLLYFFITRLFLGLDNLHYWH